MEVEEVGLNSSLRGSQFQKNCRMGRDLDISSCSGQWARQPGPRRKCHLWNHQGLSTEMKASSHCLPLKSKWVCIIMKEKDP
uniref:Alternative protein CNTN6 n=1 Tax=Homo sapiens TaxID=9606 RepID=L0R839_HUMAN|nr:alternative protein CNTN6 [Homo sapiens]